jgi:TRAP-type mannitol/chloroaromatic compound transport system substrate-binding protein
MDGGIGALIRKNLEANGIIMLDKSWTAGFHQLTTWNRLIRNVDDLQGLKLRVPLGPISIDMFKTFGASAIPISERSDMKSLDAVWVGQLKEHGLIYHVPADTPFQNAIRKAGLYTQWRTNYAEAA